MLVPLSWLRDFAPFDLDPVELGRVFDDLGMVVEAITYVGSGLADVVVARVESIQAIPGADKIRKIIVDAGGSSPLQIVCGAWNFAEGDRVPLAPVGAVLPGDFEIGRRKMRGVVSDGMLCSAAELALGDDAGGLLVLDGDAAPGTPIAEALGITADVVYDLAIEANRPDANCVAGVARDAAARLGLPFAIPALPPAAGGSAGASPFVVTVAAPDLCDRFTATVFEGIVVAPSPEHIARRLTLAGMRPISNVVDASNYVMLELGQPTHAFDLDRLPSPALGVRAARPGERLTTLDGVDRILGVGPQPDAVIVDGSDVALGIAGIMGGASSEVHDRTVSVALEAAHFVSMAIARTSKRLGLRSEASARFERGVDIEGIERSVARFAEILALTCPDLRQAGPTVDWRAPGAGERPAIRLRVARLNALLGTSLDAGDVARLLEPIGFVVQPDRPATDAAVGVTPPSFRPDVVAEVDLIEDVARHHGYANIARTSVRPRQVGRLTELQKGRRYLRSVLTGAGLSEAVGGPLVSPGDHPRAGLDESSLIASDPLVHEESVLRSSLRPGLLRAVGFNQDRRMGDLGLFEIGHVWTPGADTDTTSGPTAAPGKGLPEEYEILAAAIAGTGPDGRGGDAPAAMRLLHRISAALRVDLTVVAQPSPGLHPTRTAAVLIGGRAIGWVGEIDPAVTAAWSIAGRVGWLELDVPSLIASGRRAAGTGGDSGLVPVSRYPSSDLDLAFAVAEAEPASAVRSTLQAAAGVLAERVELFDVYRGPGIPEGTRGLAFRIRLVAPDHTLTDAERAAVRDACIAAVESAHPATLRV